MDTVYNPKWVLNTTKCPTLSVTGASKVVYPHASGFTQGSNLEGTGGVLTSEEGHRGSQLHSSEERVLQQTFSGEEKIRGVETCHRPVSTQPVHSVSTLQDGNCGFHQTSTSKRGLGNIIGFNRCLLPCDDSPEIQKVSSVLFRRENISVPGTTVRSLCKSLCVFQSLKSGLEAYPSQRYSGARISGRLDSTFCVRGSVMASQQKVIINRFRPRIPVQDFNFLGAHFNLGLALVSPSADRVALFQQAMTKLLGAKEASARQLHSLLGQMESMANLLTLGRAFKRCLQWELKERWSQSSAQWDSKIVLGPWFPNAVRPWTDIDFLKSMSPLHHPVPQLHLFTDSSLEGWGAHMEEHMASGYWSPAWKTQHIYVLEMQAVWLALQAFADYIKGNSILLSTDNTTVAAYLNRQGGTHSQSLCNMAVEIMLWCAKNRVHIKARYLPGRLNALADCLSRKGNVVQTEWSLNQRVADLVFQLWGTPRYSSEQEGTNFCISSSRPSSSCIRRSVSELEGDVGIRLPSFSPDSYHAEESARGRVPSLSDSSSMGRTGMVSSAPVSSGGSTDPAPSEEGSFVSTGVQVVTPNTSDISSSRLVAMQQHMEASGISRSVARRIYSAKRSSTNALYDYRWKSWVDWCVGREVDPFNPSVNQFGEFLIFLHNKNFSPATVKGYRSAISTTLKQISKIDFSCESILSDVVRSFELEHPRTKVHFPKWDLAIVLAALSNAPFEPLEECGFKELTLKTVFLTALASGRRRSEIHALVCSDIEF